MEPDSPGSATAPERRSRGGAAAPAAALALGLVAAAVAGAKFWLYGLILLVATAIAVWLVTRGTAGRAARILPRSLRHGAPLGAATAAVAIVVTALVVLAPLYLVRESQGEKTRARNWIRDANHELDSRDFDTARQYLRNAVEIDPDVDGLQATRERLRRLEAEGP